MDIQGQGDRITRVNKYQIGPTLGEGTFGKVKQAKNIVTGEVVAMKILDKDRILRNHMADQLKMEISMMKKLRHDNIVQLIEVLTSKTKVFIVLELASGGELFQKIANATRFNEDTARLYFRQLVRGVEFCHSLGICHRDLKPENLLLDEKGTLKISDFGLCALADKEDQLLKTQCGTPNYTAPEILLGKKYDGKPTDVWSCGVILFVMLAGYLPFEEQTSQELFKKIKAAQYNFPSFFPAGPKPLIQRILVVDPNRRYTLAQIKQDPWFLAGVPYDDSKDLKNLSKLADVKVSSSDMAHALESIDDSELQTKGGQGGKKGVDASGPQKKGPGQVVNPTFAAASGGVGATKQEDQQLPAVAGTMQRKAVGAPI
ncbi:MAG: putative CBL-interacting protein kinase 8, partial [Streblomastix strix]